MRHSVLFCFLTVLLGLAGPIAGESPEDPITIVVVRHAEKTDDDPDDPSLSRAGEARAGTLLNVLADARVAAIYSTQFRRTLDTAAPLAGQFGLTVKIREIASGQATTYAYDLAAEIRARHAGETVVVVGHSNTVPQMVQALSGIPVKPIGEAEYDHLFIVILPPGDQDVRLIRSRYGADSVAVDDEL